MVINILKMYVNLFKPLSSLLHQVVAAPASQ